MSLSLLSSASSRTFVGFSSVYSVPFRNASKKASGACRNSKQARGKSYEIKTQDGVKVFADDIIATQNRLRYHPGLNVKVTGRCTLKALKEGTVRFTCEKADLDFTNFYNQKFYSAADSSPLYKKYAHVIPTPPHNRFRIIKQV